MRVSRHTSLKPKNWQALCLHITVRSDCRLLQLHLQPCRHMDDKRMTFSKGQCLETSNASDNLLIAALGRASPTTCNLLLPTQIC
mmetsp:Transcript_31005/g.60865  ORF Transcript_31005/g.60865 Transcript_31005/m.60865 type:complete len:85 (-) Transcript_31005:7-261(-)